MAKGDNSVFKRYEYKYKLSREQYLSVVEKIKEYMRGDEHGETTVQSLYFDTDAWRLIIDSIQHPTYKEKLRARSYGLASPEKKVFVELKKKYDRIVYKRRISVPEKKLLPLICSGESIENSQIEKEILYFCKSYGGLSPAMLLLYDRTAYVCDGTDLRITFDRNIRYRTERLDLCSGLDGTLLFENGEVMMEIKTGDAYPLWLVKILSDEKIFKTSFSKYGSAYTYLFKTNKLTNPAYERKFTGEDIKRET